MQLECLIWGKIMQAYLGRPRPIFFICFGIPKILSGIILYFTLLLLQILFFFLFEAGELEGDYWNCESDVLDQTLYKGQTRTVWIENIEKYVSYFCSFCAHV